MEKESHFITDKKIMRRWSRTKRVKGEKICLVYVMESSLIGCLALIEEAKKRARHVVVSICIPPPENAVGEPTSAYVSDLKLLMDSGADVIFIPFYLYIADDNRSRCTDFGDFVDEFSWDGGSGKGHETWIRVDKIQKPLCGTSRPTFFKGIATQVAKMFNIAEPDFAVFGKKDYQQWRLICRMVRDLDFAVEIIGCENLRDCDGLALSSCNAQLSSEERQNALSIFRSFNRVKDAVCNGQIDTGILECSVIEAVHNAGGRIDYVEIVDQETLQRVDRIDLPVVLCIAVWFGKVRLVDNIELQPPTTKPFKLFGVRLTG